MLIALTAIIVPNVLTVPSVTIALVVAIVLDLLMLAFASTMCNILRKGIMTMGDDWYDYWDDDDCVDETDWDDWCDYYDELP